MIVHANPASFSFFHILKLSLSNNSLSQDESESLTISVSTAFNPRSHDEEPNLIFCSSDGVVFYVNYDVIVKASSTAFQERINDPSLASVEIPADSMKIVPISEPSSVLNLMLHALYGTPSAQHSPTFETLVAAVNNMPLYGIDPKAHISRSSHLYGTLVAYAPLYPLELYTLAAHFDLYDLAVATSSHLLSCQLSTITDEMAERMGPLYLKRLFNLHNNLFDTLKQILLSPPLPHGPTKICSFEDQRRLTRAWALASAHLAWDTRPGTQIQVSKTNFLFFFFFLTAVSGC